MGERDRPVLLYDGSCGFCARSVQLAARLPADVDVLAWQDADLDSLGVQRDAVTESVHWVAPSGGVRAGHRAVAALLAASGRPWTWLARFMLLPGVDRLSASTYHWVSRHRHRIPWPLARTPTQAPTHR